MSFNAFLNDWMLCDFLIYYNSNLFQNVGLAMLKALAATVLLLTFGTISKFEPLLKQRFAVIPVKYQS